MSPEELETLLDKKLRSALSTLEHLRPEPSSLMKIEEVAEFFKVSIVTIHQWKRKRLIPFKRISNKIYFEREEVIKALKSISNKQKYI